MATIACLSLLVCLYNLACSQENIPNSFLASTRIPRLMYTIKSGNSTLCLPPIFQWPLELETINNKYEPNNDQKNAFIKEIENILNPCWIPVGAKDKIICLSSKMPNRIPSEVLTKWLQYEYRDCYFRFYENQSVIDVLIKKKEGIFDLYDNNGLSVRCLEAILNKYFIEENVGNKNNNYENTSSQKTDYIEYISSKYGNTKVWSDGKVFWIRLSLATGEKIGVRLPK